MLAHGLNVLENGGGYSFFSAHAANSFGLALSTFVGMKRCLSNGSSMMPKWLKAYGGWMFFWATMVAVSRIFVGKHYFGDVVVGIIIGSLAGYAFARLSAYIAGKIR